jgi:hypothetical protein
MEVNGHLHILAAKGKGKVKLSLCFFLTEHNAMKAYWGSEGTTHSLTSALDGGKWSASRGKGKVVPVLN